MFLHINRAEYIDGYRLRLKFNNDKVSEVDLKDELYGEIFEPLKDKDFFKDFFISHNTIEWQNGADFAPEFLYYKCFKGDKSLVKQFEKWGYS